MFAENRFPFLHTRKFLLNFTYCRLPRPVEVHPGDELRVSCVYNSMSRDTITEFGIDTDQEMCYAFLKYYPKQNIPAPICMSYRDTDLCKAMPQFSDHFPDGIDGCSFAKYSSSMEKLKAFQYFILVRSMVCCKLLHCE